jgi:hypothetical protein
MNRIERGQAAARAASAAFPARIRAVHDRRHPDCGTWETWTERNVPAILPTGNGYADVTYDGCRAHGVAVARP